MLILQKVGKKNRTIRFGSFHIQSYMFVSLNITYTGGKYIKMIIYSGMALDRDCYSRARLSAVDGNGIGANNI